MASPQGGGVYVVTDDVLKDGVFATCDFKVALQIIRHLFEITDTWCDDPADMEKELQHLKCGVADQNADIGRGNRVRLSWTPMTTVPSAVYVVVDYLQEVSTFTSFSDAKAALVPTPQFVGDSSDAVDTSALVPCCPTQALSESGPWFYYEVIAADFDSVSHLPKSEDDCMGRE